MELFRTTKDLLKGPSVDRFRPSHSHQDLGSSSKAGKAQVRTRYCNALSGIPLEFLLTP